MFDSIRKAAGNVERFLSTTGKSKDKRKKKVQHRRFIKQTMKAINNKGRKKKTRQALKALPKVPKKKKKKRAQPFDHVLANS
eukprot:SAG11_NODE_988_length_6275_cov_10.173413_1_plen_82_part_00